MIEITKHLEQTDNPHIILYYAEADEHFCIPSSEIPTLISHLIEMGGVVANAGQVAPEYLSDEAEELLIRILRDYHLVPKKKI